MLIKKCLRDIKLNKSQFLNIFIMVFLGVFVFAGIHSYMDGMRKSGEAYYENNNLQDLWLTGENFSDDDLKEIKNIENVKDAERLLTIETELLDFKDVSIETNFIESNNIAKMHIAEGEEFDKNKSGVWFDSYLAKNLDLKVGDEIKFKYKQYEIKEKIVGLVNIPDHVYTVKDETTLFPTHKDYGYMYLSINEFPTDFIYDEIRNSMKEENPYLENVEISNEMIEKSIDNFKISDYYVFNNVIVDVDDTSKLDETKREIENKITSAIAVTNRDTNSSYVTLNSEIEEGNTYSSVFTVLFLFIAMLSVITTMNRFVKKERTQIGTLKALGIKRRKITRLYVNYGFIISLVASALGLLVGNFTIGKFFMNMEMGYFEIPVYNTVLLPIVYELAIGVILIVTLVTYLSCRKILKESAVEALRTEIPKVKTKNLGITSKGIFKKASVSTKWNIRDIGRNKGRSIMAIVGVIGCTMLLVCAFGLLDTMNSYLEWEFDVINDFKYKLSLDTNHTEEQLQNLTNNLGILSFSEKQYQFATLKVLGFKNKQIKKIFVKQNLWLSIIGIIAGLPLGYFMIVYIFKKALGENYDFIAQVNVLSYLYAAIGSLVVAIFVNKVLARKVKTIDMVSSLKGNE